jgi:hypothetical protein
MCDQVFPPDRNFPEDFDRKVETPEATQGFASCQALVFYPVFSQINILF